MRFGEYSSICLFISYICTCDHYNESTVLGAGNVAVSKTRSLLSCNFDSRGVRQVIDKLLVYNKMAKGAEFY